MVEPFAKLSVPEKNLSRKELADDESSQGPRNEAPKIRTTRIKRARGFKEINRGV